MVLRGATENELRRREFELVLLSSRIFIPCLRVLYSSSIEWNEYLRHGSTSVFHWCMNQWTFDIVAFIERERDECDPNRGTVLYHFWNDSNHGGHQQQERGWRIFWSRARLEIWLSRDNSQICREAAAQKLPESAQWMRYSARLVVAFDVLVA